MENAHFQSIVKSFSLERLVQAALGEGSLCCRFGLVRLLPAVPRGKMARFALIDCNITQPADHHPNRSAPAQAAIPQ